MIEDNVINQSSGIFLVRSDGSVIRDNYISEVLENQPIAVRRSDRVRVEGNVVRKADTGISAYGATNSLFKNNDSRGTIGVHGNAMTIYEGSHNTRIVGNRIGSGRAGMGLTLRESDGLLIAFNVIYGSRFAIAQWAQTEEGDRLALVNNTLFGNLRLRPETARRTKMANNFVGRMEMQQGKEAFPVRIHNIYGRLDPVSVQPEAFRRGERHAAEAALFRLERDGLDARPTPEGWKALSRGAPVKAAGVAVSHIGALGEDGEMPDLSPIGLPPGDPGLVHE